MKNSFLYCCLITLALSHPTFGEDLQLPNGKTFKNIQILKTEPDGIKFTHESGVAKVRFEELPDSWKAKVAFDPVKAQAFRDQTEKERREAARQVRERLETVSRVQTEEIAKAKQKLDSTPRLTRAESVKGMWINTLPWPKGMESGQIGKRKFCEYMTAQIRGGAFDLEAESTALQWNMQEYTRVGDEPNSSASRDQLSQVRLLIAERDKQRAEAEYRERQLAIQQAGVKATQNIADALNRIAFQLMNGDVIVTSYW